MRLDFNVLWIDDQPARVEAQIVRIRREMAEHGFELHHKLCTSVDEVTRLVAGDVFNDEVDLILVDWDLGGGTFGQDAIVKVREVIPYKDVVFYSANTDSAKLQEVAFKNGLEGIYCTTREDLVAEVVGVFESLIKKVLDLDHTRGIIMGATSDIDSITRDCLTIAHDRLDVSQRKALLEKALARIAEKTEECVQLAAALRVNPTLSDILQQHRVFTASDGLWMLSDVLRREPFRQSHGHYRKAVVRYRQDVVKDRNILGHQVLVRDGRPFQIVDDKGQPITIERMRELRRTLIELRIQFRSLLADLSK